MSKYKFLQYVRLLFLAVFIPFAGMASASTAVLNFTDLISGPDTGLGDGLGSGVIVTVWGQNLGNQKGSSKLYFRDASGVVHEPHIYYWKAADGQLPSGPANLYESHRMQEIAFSIPDSAMGSGQVYVNVSGQDSNALPFTVRAGNIYHVRSSGSDSNNGSFASPWRNVARAVDTGGQAPAGSTIYIHDVNSGGVSSARGIYFRNATATSTLAAQMAIISYPNNQPSSTGIMAIVTYNAQGFVVSKMRAFGSNCDETENGQRTNCNAQSTGNITSGVQTSAWGRTIANYIGEPEGRCSSTTSGAISGNSMYANYVEGHIIYGNEIDNHGCHGSSRLHHTTYMSIRDGNGEIVTPWEFGWNYLHDNHAIYGIHNFDENVSGSGQTGNDCGNMNDDLLIHNNVIVNQAGAGIHVGSSCEWSMDVRIYNNIVINAGLASDWNGVDLSTSQSPNGGGIAIRDGRLFGTMHIYNNTVYSWHTDSVPGAGIGCFVFEGGGDYVRVLFNQNVCYTGLDKNFIGFGYNAAAKADNITGSGNAWFYSGNDSPSNSVVPEWDANAIRVDPGIRLSGRQFLITGSDAAILDRGSLMTTRDIYGNPRTGLSDIGAVEYMLPPPASPLNFSGQRR